MSCRRHSLLVAPLLRVLVGVAAFGVVLPAQAAAPTDVELDDSRDAAQAIEPWAPSVPAEEARVQEDRAQAGPVRAAAPSPTFVAAERAQGAGEYQAAALSWHRIVAGATRDDRGHREMAEYHLGISLAHLGLPQASVNRFRAAAEDPKHAMHLAALSQLGKIAAGLPDPSGVFLLLSAYAVADLDRLRGLSGDDRANLAYFVGRGRYAKGDTAGAQQAFAMVDGGNAQFLEARLFESACHVRQRHSIPALESIRRGVAAIEQGAVRTRDRQRWLDLFHLTEARIYYSSAIALDPETNVPAIHQTRVSAAVKHYNLVGPESEYFAEATFELAWIYFMAGQYSFALGKIFTLDAPYYQEHFYPEAQILKSVVYEAHCNYDSATIVSARLNKRYIPIRDAIRQLLRQCKGGEVGRLHRALEALLQRNATHGSILEPTVRAAYRQRGFLRMLRAADGVEVEVANLEGLPDGWKASELGQQLRGELDLLRQASATRVDQWLRGFLQRRVDDVDEQVRNGDKIQFFRDGMSRNLLDNRLKFGQVSRTVSNDWSRVLDDEEHVIWPFDGEFWLDEIGSYRVPLLSTCGR